MMLSYNSIGHLVENITIYSEMAGGGAVLMSERMNPSYSDTKKGGTAFCRGPPRSSEFLCNSQGRNSNQTRTGTIS